jgi:hypothetical protein
MSENNNQNNDIDVDINIQKYRTIAVKFIENNRNKLISIYLQHSKTDGDGILVINLFEVESKSNIDVSFVNNEILDIDIIEKINERKTQNNNNNIIYFLLITPFEEKIIEIDIRTLSV